MYLEESGEHVEGVHGRGAVRVRQHLVDMATPRLLLALVGDRLEGGEDGREKGRRGGGGLGEAVCVTFILTATHTHTVT